MAGKRLENEKGSFLREIVDRPTINRKKQNAASVNQRDQAHRSCLHMCSHFSHAALWLTIVPVRQEKQKARVDFSLENKLTNF